MKLFGITGFKGNGKDVVGKMIQYIDFIDGREGLGTPTLYEFLQNPKSSIPMFTKWEIKKFAYKLKQMICVLLSCSMEELESDGFKDRELFGVTVRHMLQTIGTEWGRDLINSEIWVESLFINHTPESNWAITDVRFPNEGAKIKDLGGILIRVNRFENSDPHASEIHIPNLIVDEELDNTKDIPYLFNQVEKIYKKYVKN